MKTIENWFISDITGTQILRIEEEDLFSCHIRGETIEGNCFWYAILTSPIKDIWHEYVRTMHHVYLLGKPNQTYSRLFRIDTGRLNEIVTKKLKLK